MTQKTLLRNYSPEAVWELLATIANTIPAELLAVVVFRYGHATCVMSKVVIEPLMLAVAEGVMTDKWNYPPVTVEHVKSELCDSEYLLDTMRFNPMDPKWEVCLHKIGYFSDQERGKIAVFHEVLRRKK